MPQEVLGPTPRALTRAVNKQQWRTLRNLSALPRKDFEVIGHAGTVTEVDTRLGRTPAAAYSNIRLARIAMIARERERAVVARNLSHIRRTRTPQQADPLTGKVASKMSIKARRYGLNGGAEGGT